VALGGAVLGGGYGSLSRLYGLGCDHLVAAEVVLSDGRTLWCDTDREPDLFWALRGAGGGLIGVVTSFVLATRPAAPATFVECRWPIRHAVRIISAWQRFAPAAPEEINIEAGLIATHGEEPMVAVYGVSVAGTAFLDRFGPDPDQVEIRDLAGPAAALVSYPDVPDDIDVSGPPWGTRPALHLARSEFFDGDLPDAAIQSLVDYLVASPVADQSRDLELVPWGGAIARVAPEATAFVHRRARFILKHTAWAMRRASDEIRRDARRWVDGSWAISHPWGSGLIYPNYPEPGRSPLDPAYHGTNLARLRGILARYDPDGTFARS
jgi:FAD/FMN-containing dehydrogenase